MRDRDSFSAGGLEVLRILHPLDLALGPAEELVLEAVDAERERSQSGKAQACSIGMTPPL